jgi:hypothetical protein
MATLNDINPIIDSTVSKFKAGMQKTGVNAWLKIVGPLNRMDRDSESKIHRSPGNELAMQKTALEMTKTTLTNTYEQRKNSLKEPLQKIADITREYYTNNFGDILPVVEGKITGIISNYDKHINDMMGAEAVKSAIIDPTINALANHIGSRSTHNAMMIDMDRRVKDRYNNFAGPRAEDILQRFARDVNDLMRLNFQLVWVKYLGGLISTSRDFCIERNNQYFHVEEVKRWPNQEWEGKLPNTNKYNIFTVAGGYNCRHNFQFVKADKVPQSVKSRVKSAGLG